jgi:hypothetical protein
MNDEAERCVSFIVHHSPFTMEAAYGYLATGSRPNRRGNQYAGAPPF